jgi:hypothetical protein
MGFVSGTHKIYNYSGACALMSSPLGAGVTRFDDQFSPTKLNKIVSADQAMKICQFFTIRGKYAVLHAKHSGITAVWIVRFEIRTAVWINPGPMMEAVGSSKTLLSTCTESEPRTTT